MITSMALTSDSAERNSFEVGTSLEDGAQGAHKASRQRLVRVLPGALMLVVNILSGLLAVVLVGLSLRHIATPGAQPIWALFVPGLLLVAVTTLLAFGFFTLQPNESRVLVLFGKYRGTVATDGFHWANPFFTRGQKVSLRVRTLLGDRLKVNDRRGNPVEIAAMVVWRVRDTAQARFDVQDYESYVATQAETALRHIATAYNYDEGEAEGGVQEITLRGNPDEVSDALRADLGARLAPAGVVVDDARLTHLAYSPEIAQAMLRRQQAEAIISARRKIVSGAVGMVEMALNELTEHRLVDLDDERRAQMVSNLLVVLVGESDVTPVVNTGTLYQ